MSDSNLFSLLITYSIKGVTHASIKPDNNLIKDGYWTVHKQQNEAI